jgi:hypothetical protein
VETIQPAIHSHIHSGIGDAKAPLGKVQCPFLCVMLGMLTRATYAADQVMNDYYVNWL